MSAAAKRGRLGSGDFAELLLGLTTVLLTLEPIDVPTPAEKNCETVATLALNQAKAALASDLHSMSTTAKVMNIKVRNPAKKGNMSLSNEEIKETLSAVSSGSPRSPSSQKRTELKMMAVRQFCLDSKVRLKEMNFRI